MMKSPIDAEGLIARIDANWALAGSRSVAVGPAEAPRGERSWRPVAFVSSTATVLARCMGGKGVPEEAARLVLADFPDTFAHWRAQRKKIAGTTSGSRYSRPTAGGGGG